MTAKRLAIALFCSSFMLLTGCSHLYNLSESNPESQNAGDDRNSGFVQYVLNSKDDQNISVTPPTAELIYHRYTDEEHEKNSLIGLLANEKYDELDQALARADEEYRQRKINARQWEDRWIALADNNFNGIRPRYDSWIAKTGSGYAYLARHVSASAGMGKPRLEAGQ